MKIVETRVMRGPNYWSVKHPRLIVAKIDISQMAPQSAGTVALLKELLPGLWASHPGEAENFGQQIQSNSGSWAQLAACTALELQRMAGMESEFHSLGFAYVQPLSTTVFYVVFEYAYEEAGRYALEVTCQWLRHLSEAGERESLAALLRQAIEHLPFLAVHEGPSTEAILNEARRRQIPVFTQQSAFVLGYGANQQRIKAAITGQTSLIGVEMASDKDETKNLLAEAGIPVPKGTVISDPGELKEIIQKTGFPLVIKPLDSNQGKGVSTNLQTEPEALEAFRRAKYYSDRVIAESFITGSDFRMLVVDYKLVAAARRIPAAVRGDGVSTVEALVAQANRDPRRGKGHNNVLTLIELDQSALQMLAAKGLSPQSVLPEGQTVYLKMTANLSTGGTAIDVTDAVHPANRALAARIAKIAGLDICGIDIIAPDLSTSLYENGGAIIEVNAAPGLRMHLAPSQGKARAVAVPIIDMLFPPGKKARIPLVAVTGTNGKTTTTRLMAHIVKTAGMGVGFTTTDGVYIGDQLIQKGDCTGPVSAAMVLKDPTVEFAVLESARGGIVRSGLVFDHCDVGIVTNVASDHLGLGDIHTLEEMARVKSVIPQTVAPGGYAVLNADDDLVYKMAENLDCNIALFSLSPDNPRIVQHCKNGGIAAVLEHGIIAIRRGEGSMMVEKVIDVPLTFGGSALFMVQNVLAAVAAAYVSNIDMAHIRQGLRTFIPSPEQTPGRMNLFDFGTFRVLVDYAHNPAGIQAIGHYLNSVQASAKVGLVTGVGDRRNTDLVEMGRLTAEIFDELIIKQDQDLRGRDNMEIVELLKQGVRQADASKPMRVISDEAEAIAYAIENAMPGSLITICCEDVTQCLALVKAYQDRYMQAAVTIQLNGTQSVA